ncbi:DUF4139 domain-containing protein [Qipengyuania sediminis]|uniref:DUF4139 domain-containing protein n=1 Tax=Qipengyuania sediminis TaxID=1532023 RepID=UPI0010594DAF|nr:hypothetical protein [Qipengyuania sediminis]
MIRLAFLLLTLLATPAGAQEQSALEASAPTKLAVTVYRDPNRGEGDGMDRDWPRGFAMISETRTVTLPAGRSTLRFTGVAEGMVAVSAIVTGLPGGTIEKNRNAALLSPAALVDGTLGNRVTITRTNPVTGRAASESAVVRTRADGGLVLQTQSGFEAVRCSGLPEKLSFDRVPAGLSPEPVFTLDTQSERGGTHTVVLTYLAWGFDWDASYVGHLREGAGRDGKVTLDLLSWLTVVNDNGQSFADAELMTVAGKLNVESDFESLADPPEGEPLRLVCYPLGGTSEGSPYEDLLPPPPPPPPAMAVSAVSEEVIVTGSRMAPKAPALMANEEGLGDLKLYRVPEPVTVAAKAQKQIAFLDKEGVTGRFVYVHDCDPAGGMADAFEPARILFATENSERRGLGAALPGGLLTLYEPSSQGTQLVAETRLRDFAKGEEIELALAQSGEVFARCGLAPGEALDEDARRWSTLAAEVSNAGDAPVTVRFRLGWASDWVVGGLRGAGVKDGRRIVDMTVPANATRRFSWRVRHTANGLTRSRN